MRKIVQSYYFFFTYARFYMIFNKIHRSVPFFATIFLQNLFYFARARDNIKVYMYSVKITGKLTSSMYRTDNQGKERHSR